MDLKTFVAESISQICSGIIEAQKQTEETGAIVSPRCNFSSDGSTVITDTQGHIVTTSMIHFDVALSVTNSSGSEKDGSKHGRLQIADFKLEAGFSSGNGSTAKQEMESVSRMKFDIPIVWPMASADAVLNLGKVDSRPKKTIQHSLLYGDARRPWG